MGAQGLACGCGRRGEGARVAAGGGGAKDVGRGCHEVEDSLDGGHAVDEAAAAGGFTLRGASRACLTLGCDTHEPASLR